MAPSLDGYNPPHADYSATGLGVLFGKLQQGVQENQQVLTIARMRSDAEEIYGQRLGDIEGATNRIDGGFQKDDGASVKKACHLQAEDSLQTYH